MAQVPQTTIDTLAAAVYESCLKAPSDQLFSISELQGMVPGKNNLEVTQRVLNELLRTRSLSALTQGNQTVFKAAARDYADKYVSTPTPTPATATLPPWDFVAQMLTFFLFFPTCRVKNMSGDEEILYGYIQEAAREGIWTKTLKAKTNMHTTTMNKALKGLEGKRFVKAIKSVKVSLS